MKSEFCFMFCVHILQRSWLMNVFNRVGFLAGSTHTPTYLNDWILPLIVSYSLQLLLLSCSSFAWLVKSFTDSQFSPVIG